VKVRIKVIENIFVVFLIFSLFRAFVPIIEWRYGAGSIEDSSSILSIIFVILMFLYSSVNLLKNYKFTLSLFRSTILLVILIIYTLLSLIWSINITETFIRSFALLSVTLFGYWLSIKYEPSKLFRLILLSVIITIIFSALFVGMFPQFGLHKDFHYGDWRGVFLHKNIFGLALLYGVISVVSIIDISKIKKYAWFIPILLIFLILANSMTAIILSAITIMSYVLLSTKIKLYNYRYPIIVILLFFTVGLLYLFSQNYIYLFTLLGRESTFIYGGRIPMWIDVINDSISSGKYLFGYGYSAYFQSEDIKLIRSGWNPHNMHNGYLEVFINLGIVGVFLLFLFIYDLLKKSIMYANANKGENWVVIIVIVILLINITETHYMNFRWISWTVLIYVYSIINKKKYKCVIIKK